MIELKTKYEFKPKLKWNTEEVGGMIFLTNLRFEINITFRKEFILRDTKTNQKSINCKTLEEAKNQAEFVV